MRTGEIRGNSGTQAEEGEKRKGGERGEKTEWEEKRKEEWEEETGKERAEDGGKEEEIINTTTMRLSIRRYGATILVLCIRRLLSYHETRMLLR